MSKSDRRLEELALVVHASLATLHSLAIIFHSRNKGWKHAGIHTAGLIYDVRSIRVHARRLNQKEETPLFI